MRKWKRAGSVVLAIGLTAAVVLWAARDEAGRTHLEPPAKVVSGTPEALARAASSRKLKRHRSGALKPEAPDAFVRYHQLIRTPLDAPSETYAPGYRMQALQAAVRAGKAAEPPRDWRERGPGNVSGRTRALVVDPEDATGRTWYAGSVGGGVWATADAGASWRDVTPRLQNLATVSLAQGVSDPNVLYAGTGEGFGNFDAVQGDGIWKTTDRGATWTQLPSTASNASFRAVNRLMVDPSDADVVVAATDAGIFRTEDGGVTWTMTLARPSNGFGEGRLQQVVADPANFAVLYAAANSVGIYKSTDGGRLWAQVYRLASGSRLELAVAPSSPNRVYAAVYDGHRSVLYASDDAGASWRSVEEDPGDAPAWMGGQGWYDNTLAVHPYDANVVYLGGIDLWWADVRKAEEGWTRTTRHLTYWLDPAYRQPGDPLRDLPYLHADHHALVTVPLDPARETFRLIDASDGGVAYSDDQGATWRTTLNGMNTAQFYGADKHPTQDVFLGGMQDNGTFRSPAGVASMASTGWVPQLGGDGFDAVWHAEDPDRLLGSVQYNTIFRSDDGGGTWALATAGLDDVGAQSASHFLTSIAKSPSDPELVFTTGRSGVWRSDDFGGRWRLSAMEEPELWAFNGLRAPVAVSVADPQVVWAGAELSSDRRIYVSTDGGLRFAPTSALPGHDAAVTGLATHPHNAETAFATFAANGKPKVLRTTNLGASWENLTGTFRAGEPLSSNGFPNVATYTVLPMPFDADVLWAGTEIGLFVSQDGGGAWARADGGLPSVAIWRLHVVGEEVVAATHGRGVWSVHLPELEGYAPSARTRAPRLNTATLAPAGARVVDLSLRSPYDSTVVAHDYTPLAALPANGAPLDTTLRLPVHVDAPRTAAVTAVAYRDRRAFRSATDSLRLFAVDRAQAGYATDLNEPNGDFFGDFEIREEGGFDDGAIHSPHPYPDNATLTYQLGVPIRVAAENAYLRYRDVALVEAGEEGTRFGEHEFWDYVVVEGTTDGVTWVPLADGYDARAAEAWKAAYERNENGTGVLFVPHVVDLLQTFAPGDVLFIRFRLFADAGVHAWGWAIDDLEIQTSGSVGTDADDVVVRFALAQNYPNPFNPETTVPFSLAQSGDITLRVYDLQGRRVATLADGWYPAGAHRVRWDARSLASGIYVYRLETGTATAGRMAALLK